MSLKTLFNDGFSGMGGAMRDAEKHANKAEKKSRQEIKIPGDYIAVSGIVRGVLAATSSDRSGRIPQLADLVRLTKGADYIDFNIDPSRMAELIREMSEGQLYPANDALGYSGEREVVVYSTHGLAKISHISAIPLVSLRPDITDTIVIKTLKKTNIHLDILANPHLY